VALLVALAMTGGACVVPIDVAGGPQRVSHRLRPDHIGEDMRPLVADEPAARARLDEVESNARVSRVALWTGFGLLGACLLVSMSSSQATASGGGGDGALYSIIGLCGASIAAEVVSLVYAPTKRTWGDPLRVYNQNRPHTPWASAELSVAPPPVVPLPGVAPALAALPAPPAPAAAAPAPAAPAPAPAAPPSMPARTAADALLPPAPAAALAPPAALPPQADAEPEAGQRF
jgi:hypothetical protein